MLLQEPHHPHFWRFNICWRHNFLILPIEQQLTASTHTLQPTLNWLFVKLTQTMLYRHYLSYKCQNQKVGFDLIVFCDFNQILDSNDLVEDWKILFFNYRLHILAVYLYYFSLFQVEEQFINRVIHPDLESKKIQYFQNWGNEWKKYD